MEPVWNMLYLFAGAIIATSVSIIAEKIKNKGKILFYTSGLEFETAYELEKDRTGDWVPSQKISHYGFSTVLEIVNTSYEQKILRNIHLEITLKNKKKIELLEIRVPSNKTKYGTRQLKILNLSPKSVHSFKVTSQIDYYVHASAKDRVYIVYENEKQKLKKEFLGKMNHPI